MRMHGHGSMNFAQPPFFMAPGTCQLCRPLLCPTCADLAREVSKEIPNVKVDFMKASSYGAASQSSGDVTVKGASTLAKWEHYNILLVRGAASSVWQMSLLIVHVAGWSRVVQHMADGMQRRC